jgi:hypothetical protein
MNKDILDRPGCDTCRTPGGDMEFILGD